VRHPQEARRATVRATDQRNVMSAVHRRRQDRNRNCGDIQSKAIHGAQLDNEGKKGAIIDTL
jgi:hypothetical protein